MWNYVCDRPRRVKTIHGWDNVTMKRARISLIKLVMIHEIDHLSVEVDILSVSVLLRSLLVYRILWSVLYFKAICGSFHFLQCTILRWLSAGIHYSIDLQLRWNSRTWNCLVLLGSFQLLALTYLNFLFSDQFLQRF